MRSQDSFFALVAAVSAAPSLLVRQEAEASTLDVADALWDGECFYPKPTSDFELDQYLGRWYQMAGTPAPFSQGCSCIFAEYILNENGTVNVMNSCQLGDQEITIQGNASPPDEAYGEGGAFRVQFPPRPPPVECAGPNYIVQKYEPQWAIVQASNFTTLFLLSRYQQPSPDAIEEWLQEAGKLGSNLAEVELVSQESCMFT